jgi:hypothetical protein
MSLGYQTTPLGNPNVCSDPYTPSFWLGLPGALTNIRMPNAGYSRVFDDKFAVHNLLESQAVDRSPYACRTWQFDHEWLTPQDFTVLMEYATRQRGFGPFILVDPQMKNLLTPNQASGTDALHTTEGFSVTGTGEVLSSSTAAQVQGQRSLAWQLSPPVTGNGGVLKLTTPTQLYGWCLPVGSGFAFSGSVRSNPSVDNTFDVTPRVVLMNGTGVVQSTISGVVITTVTGGWQTFCVTGVIPSGTGGVYIQPQLSVTGNSVSGTAVLLIDQLQLENRATCTTWEYGQGQPLVGVRPDGESVPRILRTTVGYVAVEVT